MMAAEIFHDLKAQGYQLCLEGGRLKVQGAKPLPEETMDALRANKPELLEILKAEAPCPYLDKRELVVIPFASPAQYHWWKPGSKRVKEIQEELENSNR